MLPSKQYLNVTRKIKWNAMEYEIYSFLSNHNRAKFHNTNLSKICKKRQIKSKLMVIYHCLIYIHKLLNSIIISH